MKNKKNNININQELEKAIQHHQSGQLDQAEKIYTKILKNEPNHADALHLFGVIAHQKGDNDKAIEFINKAIQYNPQSPSYYYVNLGSAYHATNDLFQAIVYYQQALKINPNDILALNNLGNAYKTQNNFYEAINSFQKAIKINPNDCELYVNLGNLYQQIGNIEDAVSCFKKAIQLKPNFSTAFFNMGNAHLSVGSQYQAQTSLDEAVNCYKEAIKNNPSHAETYNNLGNVYKMLSRQNEAMACFEKALNLKPTLLEPYQNLGTMYEDQSKLEKALYYYNKYIELMPNHGIEVRISLALPVINESKESILIYRDKIKQNIAFLKQRKFNFEDPYNVHIGSPNFLFAYHGLNDIEIQKELASFYIDSCPELTWTSPHVYNKSENKKIKIGFISKNLCNHTIGELNYGLIKNLSRDKFHVSVFHVGKREDQLTKLINDAADEIFVLPLNLKTARSKISENALDILFYLDIGMEPFTYFLSFSRLAHIQCVTWGHPDTTGVPNMDYFISSESAEIINAKEHYSEELALLKLLGTYFYRPKLIDNNPNREKFNIPQNYNLYVCPQSSFKFHPDFDEILSSILRKDKNGLIVLLEGRNIHWTDLLKKRFSNSFSESMDRIKFLPRMPQQDFLQLFKTADVVLDTPVFGGGKTSLEAFAFSAPIVTLPSPFLRARLTYGFYKQMGILDCIADSSQSYVEIAVELANNKRKKEEIQNKIANNSHVLFENIEVIREFEAFFEKVFYKEVISR